MTNDRPGTDHVISGPMRGLIQTAAQTDRRTCRLYPMTESGIWEQRISCPMRIVAPILFCSAAATEGVVRYIL